MVADDVPLPFLSIRHGRMVLRRAGTGAAGHAGGRAAETLAEFPFAEGAEDAALAAVAAALGEARGPVALGLPESVVRVLTLEAPGPGREVQRRQIAAALEGVTPYPVADLVFDWCSDAAADAPPDGPQARLRVAVVARETLAEAAAALGAHGLALGSAHAEGIAGFDRPARFDLSADRRATAPGPGSPTDGAPAIPPAIPLVVSATPKAHAEALERIFGRLVRLRARKRSGRRALGIALTAVAVVGGLALVALAARGGGHAEAERAALPAIAPQVAAPPAGTPTADGRLAQAQTGDAPAAGAISDAASPGQPGQSAPDPTLSRIGAVAAAAQPRLSALQPPRIAAQTRADPPARGLPPPPPGVVYTLDAEGAVVPTAEGVLLADGVRLFAGAPPVLPPLPPGRAAAPAPSPRSEDAAVAAAVGVALGSAIAAGPADAAENPPAQAPPGPAPQAAAVPEPPAEAAPEPVRASEPVAIPPQPPAVRAALRAAEARRNVVAPPLPPRLARPAPAAEPPAPPPEAAAAPDPAADAAAPAPAAAPEPRPLAFAPPLPPRLARPAPAAEPPAPPPEAAAAPDPAADAAAPAPAAAPEPRPLAFAPPPRPVAAAPATAPSAPAAPAGAAPAPQAPLALAPPPRPAGLSRPQPAPEAVARAAGAAVAAPPPRPAGLRPAPRRADPGAPAVVSSGAEVRTPSGTERIVAREATSRGLDMGRVNLIGVFGTQQNRTALIREVDGRIRRVKVGDRIEGGRVAAIGSDELRYVRDGQNITLRMPRN